MEPGPIQNAKPLLILAVSMSVRRAAATIDGGPAT
jgi:hypothetical protein